MTDENFYRGSGFGFSPTYGLKEDYGESFLKFDYRTPAGQIGPATDVRTANQLQQVSAKISTGAKVIEASGVFPQVFESIPKQQFKEINRLKKLVGVDITFHGPLVEATGFNQNSREVKEGDRLKSEKQMIDAIERGHELDPKGNVVVTFHSSNGLPDPETKIIDEKGEEVLKDFWIVDEYSGRYGNVAPEINYLKGTIERKVPKEFLEKQNKDAWFAQLENVNFNVRRGADPIKQITKDPRGEKFLKLYGKLGAEEAEEANKIINELVKEGVDKEYIEENIQAITFGEVELRQAYQQFQNVYNQAYDSAKKTSKKDLEKLDKFREEIKSKLDVIESPAHVNILAEELQKGIRVLRTVNPQIYKPMRDWAIDRASETFSNVAVQAYKKFKDTSPIISIENPPAGSGLSRADDLRDLVEEARRKFVDKAQEDLGLSKTQAEDAAKKVLGVTWDVGHINMIRGFGYKEKDVIAETKKIAPFVKHVHLSDNFGVEHTELPMGMGNVPTKKMLDLIHGYNKQVKKIVETGNWYEHFKISPMKETFAAFGSPVYSGENGPYWNQAIGIAPGYFVGHGNINPDIHHSLYGAGFSNLPVELGGQMAGKSRVSGAPME